MDNSRIFESDLKKLTQKCKIFEVFKFFKERDGFHKKFVEEGLSMTGV